MLCTRKSFLLQNSNFENGAIGIISKSSVQRRRGLKQAKKLSFFANLTTFEQRSGLKIISFLKIAILKWGDYQNFKVIGPEEMPILVWGRRKRPPTKIGST